MKQLQLPGSAQIKEEGRTYVSRSFTMPSGQVFAITMDDWYFDILDWLTQHKGYSYDQIVAKCHRLAYLNAYSTVQEGFETALGCTVQALWKQHKHSYPD